MDKENPLNQQVNSIPSDALNTPSKEQEQLLETSSQNVQNSNNNANKKMLLKVYLEKISPFQQRIQIYSYLLSYAANALAELILLQKLIRIPDNFLPVVTSKRDLDIKQALKTFSTTKRMALAILFPSSTIKL